MSALSSTPKTLTGHHTVTELINSDHTNLPLSGQTVMLNVVLRCIQILGTLCALIGLTHCAGPSANKEHSSVSNQHLKHAPTRSWNNRLSARCQAVEGLIARAAQKHQMDPALIAGIIRVESSFVPSARSRVGARGLMQVLLPCWA